MKSKLRDIHPLPVLAAVVVIAAAAVTLIPSISNPQELDIQSQTQISESDPSASSDLVIQTADIGTEASYFDYDADGITIQVFAVEASDGTIRLALNTCQVCNGSPYAYFVQDGDWFICQNCGNRFASTEIGIVSGGCRPVPITEDVYTQEGTAITIPASYLEENASLFRSWKNF